MKTRNIITLIILVATALIIAGCVENVQPVNPQNPTTDDSQITNFEECAKYYPVMESYPRQCRTESGKHFVEEINTQQNNENIEMLATTEIATFAGGCFWCTESDFEKADGVIEVISGYTAGQKENPTYKEVSSGSTGHTEAVQVTYDPSIISYEELLTIHWTHHDPTDADGQFVDRGKQYRPGIYYHNEYQKMLAEESKQQLEESGIFEKPIVTEIEEFTVFYDAEEYHQDYYTKNPVKYKFYRGGSGRDRFLNSVWLENEFIFRSEIDVEEHEYPKEETVEAKNTNQFWKDFQKPSEEQLKQTLSPIQFKVTQEDGTEKPFENEYWDNKEDGIYVDIVSKEPLYSSKDKYVSGTGWPSFTKPLVEENIVKKTDFKLIYPRTEIRSKYGNNHIGHVFNDGPEPTGKRYCMNSAALEFVPKDELEERGYGEFVDLFE